MDASNDVSNVRRTRGKPPPRMMEVVRREHITPNMLRLTFGGSSLGGFPVGCETANIKLLLPHAEQTQQSYIASLAGSGAKPIKRTYTVLEYRADHHELDVDFALHEQAGPATLWATKACVGDVVAIAGPGAPKRINLAADWFFLAGDMSAMPGISANILTLPTDARGVVVLEVLSGDDKQPLVVPPGMAISWVVNPFPNADAMPLVDAFKRTAWQDGVPSVWLAGESNSVRELRRYLVDCRCVPRALRYTSGYWQRGLTEDAYQLVKRNAPLD